MLILQKTGFVISYSVPPSKIGLFRILNIDRKKCYLTDTKENKEKPLFFLMSDHMNANGW